MVEALIPDILKAAGIKCDATDEAKVTIVKEPTGRSCRAEPLGEPYLPLERPSCTDTVWSEHTVSVQLGLSSGR